MGADIDHYLECSPIDALNVVVPTDPDREKSSGVGEPATKYRSIPHLHNDVRPPEGVTPQCAWSRQPDQRSDVWPVTTREFSARP